MVVLNIFGKIEPICICNKLKLYISNLPNGESNNWNKELVDEMRTAVKMNIIESEKLGMKPNINIREIYSRHFPQNPLSDDTTEEVYLQKNADNMICLYFDYSYQDMPLGDWDTNCFDGRLCEEDYAEKVIDFINFVSSGKSTQIPSFVPQWVYSSNHDLQNCHRIFWGEQRAEIYIESLKKWGQLFDIFLKYKNDYLQLDYLMNSIHTDNDYNTYHYFKMYSLCQLFLEKSKESELDWKLPQFLDHNYPLEERNEIAKLLRQMRNKIAHGDFIGLENKIEEYAQKVMDGRYSFDYSEYSRKNWVLLNACCLLEDTVRNIIIMLFTDREKLKSIKDSTNIIL